MRARRWPRAGVEEAWGCVREKLRCSRPAMTGSGPPAVGFVWLWLWPWQRSCAWGRCGCLEVAARGGTTAALHPGSFHGCGFGMLG